MKFNTWFKLIVLSVLCFYSNAKKCCNKDCTAAISKGRAITTFQDPYPGFLTYLSGDVVTVLSKDNIQGIEFWEADVGGQTGFIEAAAVKEYSTICMPIEVNDGVHFFSKTKDIKNNVNELNIFSLENIFKQNSNNQTSWYGIPWLVSETLEFYKELTNLLWDLDSFIKLLEWYINGDGRVTTIAMLIVCTIIISHLRLMREMKLKDEQILKLVEKAAHVNVVNFDLRTKIEDTERAAKDLEDRLNLHANEKTDLEQKVFSFKDNERIYKLNLEYLQDKIQQLEAQEFTTQEENSTLTLANNHCISTIDKLVFDKETLEAINDQLEDDRQRLKIELDQKDKLLAKTTSHCGALKTSITQLKAGVESRKCVNVDNKGAVEDLVYEVKLHLAECIGVENLATNIKLSTHGLMDTEEFAERNQWLSRIEDSFDASEVQKQLIETQLQHVKYMSKQHTATLQLEMARTDSETFKEQLEVANKELEVCKKDLEKEKAKSEVIVEFYKDTLHTNTHSCNHLKSGNVVNLSLYKQCQELKDQVQQLEAGMGDLELEYISKLNHELKQNIKGLETLQNAEQKLYKSQKELTQCHKRVAQFEAQYHHISNPGRNLESLDTFHA